MHYRMLFAALLTAAPAPFALQAAEMAASPLATNANQHVPETPYNSVFTDYRPFRAQSLAPWREVNDQVHKAGGHIGIFRNPSGVAKSPAAAPKPHAMEHQK